jgi:hypothetical protein
LPFGLQPATANINFIWSFYFGLKRTSSPKRNYTDWGHLRTVCWWRCLSIWEKKYEIIFRWSNRKRWGGRICVRHVCDAKYMHNFAQNTWMEKTTYEL